ncbi:MAG TPA: DegV family protein [Solirubrobacteraceae bacterium]|jgi:DegV family protein with EDD domain|nr:DegV family protein [Solirubrobacteraceae bacterium]
MPVAVVTDTCHYLPREIVERCGLHEVGLYVHRDGKAQRESEIVDYNAYYGSLASVSELPTTSQPSIGDFLAVYEPLIASGHEIVSIHLSGGLSGTVRSAAQAREQLGHASDRVHVIDSSTACGAQGLMLMAAAAAIAGGGDAAAAAQRAQQARTSLQFLFALDSLEYLRKGGRIGGAQAWLGSALRIKPILSLESEIGAVERVRTSRKAFERLVTLIEKLKADGADGWVVQHTHIPDQAEALAERGREIFGSEPVFISEIGPVIGTHIGPGLLGVGGTPKSLTQP